jgi:cell division protein FtsQ
VPRLLLVSAAAVAALAVGGWLALNSSLVEVREVTVEGTSRLSVSQVLDAAAVRGGESLFALDPDGVAQRVQRLPAVASVDVNRDWPHRVVITVTERRPVAVVTEEGTSTLLDATGVAFAQVPQPPDGLVPVTLGAPIVDDGADDARAAMAVLDSLPKRVRHQVTELHAASPENVSFELRNGRQVVWGSAADGARKSAVLIALLHRPASVYDVSTPEVVVTR